MKQFLEYQINSSRMNSPVVLTGATGYLGSQILKNLLEKGYEVRITTRNKKKTLAEKWLKPYFDKYEVELSVHYGDLLEDGSFDEVMIGAKGLIHAASPFKIDGIKDAKKELIEPAKKGTRNVIQSAEKANTIDSIVVTSSVAAVYGDAVDINLHQEGVFNEKHWNVTSSEHHQPYSFSKTEAEKEAWRLNDGKGWVLNTINPGFILGPSETDRDDSTSIQMVTNLLNGKFKQGVPDLYFSVVDVRDVAEAHVRALAYEKSGRFICTSQSLSLLQVAEKLNEEVGHEYKNIPKKNLPTFLTYLVGPLMAGFSWSYLRKNLGVPVLFSNGKIREELGLEFRPVNQTLKDQAIQLKKDGVLK